MVDMSELPPPPPPPPPPPNRAPGGRGNGSNNDQQKRPARSGFPRWTPWVLVGLVLVLLFGQQLLPSTDREKLDYTEFVTQVEQGKVADFTVNNSTLSITGHYTDDAGGKEFSTTAPPNGPSDDDRVKFDQAVADHGLKYTFKTPQSNFFVSLIPLLLPFVLIIGFLIWM